MIDIIGEIGVDDTVTVANFAEDITLVRLPTITGPSTTFDIADWESIAQDTVTDIGTHTVS